MIIYGPLRKRVLVIYGGLHTALILEKVLCIALRQFRRNLIDYSLLTELSNVMQL